MSSYWGLFWNEIWANSFGYWHTVEYWCSWSSKFRNSTFRDDPFQRHLFDFSSLIQTNIRCGWWVCFLHCPAIAQITLRSVKLHRLIAVLLYWLRLSCNSKCILCCRKVFVFVDSKRFFLFMLFWVILNS